MASRTRNRLRRRRGYWILFHWSECAICGQSDNSRERVYDRPKPKDERKRHSYGPEWACDHHFL